MTKQIPWNKGKKLSDDHKKHLSESHMGYVMPKSQRENIGNSNRGKKKPFRTDEHRKHLSESHKGKHHSPETEWKTGQHISIETEYKKGNVPFTKGKKRTCLEKKKISESRKKKCLGENHWNWKGGLTDLNTRIRHSDEYKEWRTQIFGRDNFTCQECGVRGNWLEAHHIKRFSKIIEDNNIVTLEQAFNCPELWDLNNGITLCDECHDKTIG